MFSHKIHSRKQLYLNGHRNQSSLWQNNSKSNININIFSQTIPSSSLHQFYSFWHTETSLQAFDIDMIGFYSEEWIKYCASGSTDCGQCRIQGQGWVSPKSKLPFLRSQSTSHLLYCSLAINLAGKSPHGAGTWAIVLSSFAHVIAIRVSIGLSHFLKA